MGTSATNSFNDTGLQGSTVYSYTVSAYDATGNNSAQSTAALAITSSIASTLSVGSNIVTTTNLNVRSSASIGATLLGTQPKGSFIGGPANGYIWWQINYSTSPTLNGWSIAPYISPVYSGGPYGVGMTYPSMHLSASVEATVASLWKKAQELLAQISIIARRSPQSSVRERPQAVRTARHSRSLDTVIPDRNNAAV